MNTDYKMILGDHVDFDFNQDEIKNINLLLRSLKDSLASNPSPDKTKSVEIFSTEVLVEFLVLSLSEFNQTPEFSNFTFQDENFIRVFRDILVEGAVLKALTSQALIERGREITLTDCGVSFVPPNISDMLQAQYRDMVNIHFEKLKNIKMNISDF